MEIQKLLVSIFFVEISKIRLGKYGDPKNLNQDWKSESRLKIATRRFQHFWNDTHVL